MPPPPETSRSGTSGVTCTFAASSGSSTTGVLAPSVTPPAGVQSHA